MKRAAGRPHLGTHSVFNKKPAESPVTQPPVPQPESEDEVLMESAPGGDKTKRVLLAFRVSKATLTQLRFLAAELDRKQQSLFEEGLNEVFKKYGKPPIA